MKAIYYIALSLAPDMTRNTENINPSNADTRYHCLNSVKLIIFVANCERKNRACILLYISNSRLKFGLW